MIDKKLNEINSELTDYRGLYITVPGSCIIRKRELALLLKKRQVYLKEHKKTHTFRCESITYSP